MKKLLNSPLNRYKTKNKEPIKPEVVYERIGMALISTQRVEFVSKNLVKYLKLVDRELSGISSSEFLKQTPNVDKLGKYTLGRIFTLLKLNPNISLENEFNEYLDLRNKFVHSFWIKYLNTTSENQKKSAIDFCFEIGKYSVEMESFFKGLTYLLALTHVKDKSKMDSELMKWENDFNFFRQSMQNGTFRMKKN